MASKPQNAYKLTGLRFGLIITISSFLDITRFYVQLEVISTAARQKCTRVLCFTYQIVEKTNIGCDSVKNVGLRLGQMIPLNETNKLFLISTF